MRGGLRTPGLALLFLPSSVPSLLSSDVLRSDEGKDGACDLVERQDEVDNPGLDRCTRHPEELGRLILGDEGPAHLLDRARTHRAVCTRPAQDHGERALLEARSNRFEEQV